MKQGFGNRKNSRFKVFDRLFLHEADKNRDVIISDIPKRFFSEDVKILDTGIGDARLPLALSEKLGIPSVNITGIEIDEESIAKARKTGVNVVRHDLNEKLPFASRSFDIVLSNQTIEHLYHTDKYIQEIRRVLKDDGILLLTTVNLAALHYRFMLLFGQQPIVLHPSVIQFGNFERGLRNIDFCHKSVFTFNALREFMEYYGFTVRTRPASMYTRGIYPLPSFISIPICKLFPNFGSRINIVATKKRD